jgi:GTP-binding protein
MKITSARYIISSPTLEQSPYHDYPEIAFIGRSNVGKSSIINALTHHKGLAKTSSTPGKTRLINFFEIITDKKPFYIVDLPGYGYAKISKKQRQTWVDASSEYLLKRKQLAHLFILVDMRHKPQAIDLEFLAWASDNGIPYSIIGTKSDKLNQKETSRQSKLLTSFFDQYKQISPMIISSATTGKGISEIHSLITTITQKN